MAEWIVEAESLEALENGFYAIKSAKPIVRCKDCKHREDDPNEPWCNEVEAISVDDDFYCAYGEKDE